MKNFYEVLKQLKKIDKKLKKDVEQHEDPNEYQLELIRSAKKLCMHESRRYQRMALMLDNAASEYKNWETIYQKSLYLNKKNEQALHETVSHNTFRFQPEPMKRIDIPKIKEQAEESTWGEFLSSFGIDLTGRQSDTDTKEHVSPQEIREKAQTSTWEEFLSSFGIDLTGRQSDTDTEEHVSPQEIREKAQTGTWEEFLSDFGIDMNNL